MAATRVPALPPVPTSLDPMTASFLRAVKEVIETRGGQRRGSDSARYVTKGELDTGLGVDIARQSLDLSDSVATLDVPDAPRDLAIVNEVFCNNLSWTNPSNRHVSHIEIWAAEDSQSRDDALILGYETVHDDQRGKRATFTHSALNIRKAYTYWLRSVTHSGVYSPWCPPDGQGGYIAPASIDKSIEEVMGMLTGDGADGLPFVTGVVAGKETVGLNGNLVIDGSIMTRMLAAGLVTADKVSAEDVFTMNLQSGNYSAGSSGFKLDAGAGTAEFNNITLRISNPAAVRSDLNVEEGATNDSGIYYPGTTKINGGQLHSDSEIIIGDLSGDYCRILAGDLTFYRIFGTGEQYPYKSVTSIDSGECENGQWKRLNGRWKERPYVQVSPSEMMSYNDAHHDCTQILSCPNPTPVEEPRGSGIWFIKPRAVLKLGPNVTNIPFFHAVEKEFSPRETEGSRGPYWSSWKNLGNYSYQKSYAYKYVVNLTASYRCTATNFEGTGLHIQYSYDNSSWVDLFYFDTGGRHHNNFKTWSQDYDLTQTVSISSAMRIYFRGRGWRNWSGSSPWGGAWYMKVQTNTLTTHTAEDDSGVIDGTLNYLAVGK